MRVDPILFYGLCAMSATGFITALVIVFKKQPEQGSLFDPPAGMPEPPQGCTWVAVQTKHAHRARELFGPR